MKPRGPQGENRAPSIVLRTGSCFAQPMPANVADHVAAVAVFGNPSIRLLGGPLNALSPLYGYKTLDLCNGADPRVLERR